jgi:hypothetical protein
MPMPSRREKPQGLQLGNLTPLALSLDPRIVAPFTRGQHYLNLAPNAPSLVGSSDYSGVISRDAAVPSALDEAIVFGTHSQLGIGTAGMTLVFRGRIDPSLKLGNSIVGGNAPGGIAYRCGVHWPAGGIDTVYFDYGGIGDNRISTSMSNVPDGTEVNTYVFTAGPFGIHVWIDGAMPSGLSKPGALTRSYAGTDTISIGNAQDSSGQNSLFKPEVLWWFNEQATQSVARQLSLEPYSLLVAPERRFFIMPLTAPVIADVRSGGSISKEESAAKIKRRNKRLIRQITQDDEEVLALYLAIHG